MPTIRLSLDINAPQRRCFDLARCVEFHVHSMARTGESAVAGVTRGLLSLSDEVTWEARHFGVRQRLTSRITAFDAPHSFADEQVSGAFRRFRHEHRFEPLSPLQTRVSDIFDFESPLGPLGAIANTLFLTAYMRRLLTAHAANLKATLASDRWRAFLPDADPTRTQQ